MAEDAGSNYVPHQPYGELPRDMVPEPTSSPGLQASSLMKNTACPLRCLVKTWRWNIGIRRESDNIWQTVIPGLENILALRGRRVVYRNTKLYPAQYPDRAEERRTYQRQEVLTKGYNVSACGWTG